MTRQEWEAAAAAGTVDALAPERLDEMWAWTQAHGPPNCWTGSSGHPAAMIRELLRERAMLLRELQDDSRSQRVAASQSG